MQKRLKSLKFFYYVQNDLNYKYSLNSSFKQLDIHKIYFNVSLPDVVNSLDSKSVSAKELEIKSFLFQYFLLGSCPAIKAKKIKQSNKKVGKEIQVSYSLLTTIVGKENILSFLIFLFIENQAFLNFSEIKNNFEESREHAYTFKVGCDKLFSLQTVIKSVNLQIDMKELFIDIKVLLRNKINFSPLSKNVLKMFPFFWSLS